VKIWPLGIEPNGLEVLFELDRLALAVARGLVECTHFGMGGDNDVGKRAVVGVKNVTIL